MIMASLPSLFAFIGGIAMIFSERIKGQVSAICHIVTGKIDILIIDCFIIFLPLDTEYETVTIVLQHSPFMLISRRSRRPMF